MYLKESLEKYLNDLAACKPAPGGGSAAALTGALGAALLEMVCNFTLGNEKYKDIEPEIKKHCEATAVIRNEFSRLIDEDVRAYSEIRDAFKTKDKKIIDNALKCGCGVCLKICSLSQRGLELACGVSQKGNINLITDVGCGADLLRAAFNAGIFNCEINLNGIEDTGYVEKQKKALADLEKKSKALYEKAISGTRERMK